MNCEQAREVLAASVADGSTVEGDASAHLAACAACRQEVDALRSAAAVWRAAHVLETTRGRRSGAVRGPRVLALAGLAAAAALVAAAFWWPEARGGPPVTPRNEPSPDLRLAAAPVRTEPPPVPQEPDRVPVRVHEPDPDAVPAGSLTCSGAIRDADGRGVPGIWVHAITRARPAGWNTVTTFGDGRCSVQTRTAADGTWRIPGLAAGEVEIEADPDDRARYRIVGPATRTVASGTSGVDFTAKMLFCLHFDVADAVTGAPLPEARAYGYGDAAENTGGRMRIWGALLGGVILDAPGYIARSIYQAHDGPSVQAPDGKWDPADIHFSESVKLQPGHTLSGRVLAATGVPLNLRRHDARPGVFAELLSAAPAAAAWTIISDAVDESGRYAIDGLPAGRYLVRALGPGLASDAQEVALDAGSATLDLTLQPWDPAAERTRPRRQWADAKALRVCLGYTARGPREILEWIEAAAGFRLSRARGLDRTYTPNSLLGAQRQFTTLAEEVPKLARLAGYSIDDATGALTMAPSGR